jgi:phosphate transport system substrate-binding protein
LLKQFLQVPIGLGGVAIPYNIPTLKAHTTITLNATVLARIYQGKITKWNNKAIRRLNPKINLPDKKIIVVARGDSSGTTYIFTNFLHAAAHSVWPAQPSKTPLALPAGGIAGTGNAGVAADVENTKYSIGYVEYSYVLLNSNLLKGVAAIVNKAGVALKPTLKGIAADAAQKPNVLATNFSIVYQRGRKSYPIAGYTWAVIWALNPTNNAQGVLLVKYLDWLSHSGTVNGKISGQNIAAFEGYVPLPANIQALATRTLVLAKSKRVFQGGKWHKVRLLTTTNSYEVLK